MLVSYGQQTMVHNGSSSCLNLIVIPPLRFVLRFVALLKTENVFVVFPCCPPPLLTRSFVFEFRQVYILIYQMVHRIQK